MPILASFFPANALTTILLSMIPCSASQTPLPVPDVSPLYTYEHAGEGAPDARRQYKIVFDVNSPQTKADEANLGLVVIARLLNTYAQFGVTRAHRSFVVVSRGDVVATMENEAAYRRQHMGRSNPDMTLIRALAKAGVVFVVDGPSLYKHGLSSSDLQSGVQVHVAANLTFLDLEAQGYVYTSTKSLQEPQCGSSNPNC